MVTDNHRLFALKPHPPLRSLPILIHVSLLIKYLLRFFRG